MKLAIFSDTHFGFGQGTERFEESFENVQKAVEICVAQQADCILLPGDIFDEAIPSQETWREAFKSLSVVKQTKSSLKAVRVKNSVFEQLSVSHIPIIAIHGTHEFRGKRFANALEVMEKAGILFYVHAGYIELQKQNDCLVIHGLGGVPEKKALDALHAFGPKPLLGKKNILVLHQSIKELLPFGDEMIASISFSDLPKGFDLIVNGHFHLEQEHDLGHCRFYIPGSTIITQMKKPESEKPKGVAVFDTQTLEKEFFPLPEQRRLFHETISFESASIEQIKQKAESVLGSLLNGNVFEKRPLVRLRLRGSLVKGVSPSDVSLDSVLSKFSEKAIISLDKNFSEASFRKKIEELRNLQKSKKSVASLGLELLEKNLSEAGFDKSIDVSELFSLLEEGKIEETIVLLSKQKNS